MHQWRGKKVLPIRVLLVIAMLTLLGATPVSATSLFPEQLPDDWSPERLNLPPIRIVNDANDVWSVKVWSYPGSATTWQALSCQTLDYDFAWARHVEPFVVEYVTQRLSNDHCGHYESLTFWFRAWNRETGVYREFGTFGIPAPWGATWRFNGTHWTCTGCH